MYLPNLTQLTSVIVVHVLSNKVVSGVGGIEPYMYHGMVYERMNRMSDRK